MRTNVLNDLSNVVKKGTGLACSWSQVGRMSEGAPDEHPMSIRSASDGERWKPAGEKGSTRVWKHVAMIFAVLVMSMANIGMAWGANGDVLFNQGFGSATAVAYSANTARSYSTSSTLSGLVGTGDNLFQGAQCNNKTNCGIAINTTSGANSYTTAGTFQAYANNTSFKWALYRTTNFAATAPTAIKFEMDVTPKYIDNKQALAVVVGSGFSVGTSKPGWTAGYTGFNIITNSTSTGKIYIGKVGGTTSIQTTTGMTSGTNYHITWVINATGDDLTYTGPDSKSYTLATAKWDMWVGTTRIISGQDRTKTGGTDFSGTTMQNLYIGNDVSGKHEVIIDNVKVTDLTPDPCDAADLTASNITSNGDQEAGTGITFSKVGTPASGDTWYWQTSATGTDKTYNATSPYTTATTAGSYTVYLRAFNTDCWGEAASMTNTIYPAPSAMIHNTFAVNDAWSSTIATQDKTNITSLSALAAVGESVGSGSNKSGLTQKIPSQLSEDASKYMSLSFNVASGKQLNVTSVVFDEQPVTGTGTFKVSISDNQGSTTKTQTIASDAAGSKHTLTLDGDIVGSFKGTVTVKVWAYGWGDGYRFGDYFYINGTVTASCSAPTTTFANGSYTIGGGALDLSTLIGSNNSSGAITYTVKNANGTGASISTASFTASSAGTCTVTATQAANGDKCEKVMDATITVSAPAGSGWGIAGTMNSWTAASNEMTGSGPVSTTISLDANTQYAFKVVDMNTSTWHTNTGTIKGGITNWDFSTTGGSDNNCYIRTSCAGDYTFTYNTSTNKLSVTYPNSHKVYFDKDGASWSNIYAYGYNDNDWNIGWPGIEITSNTEDHCGTEYYAYTNGYTYIIFNNGSGGVGNQTGNITVAGYEGKHAVGAAATGWTAYPTYTVTYDGNGKTGGSVPTDASSPYACSSTVTVLGNTGSLEKTGYNFLGWNTQNDGNGTDYTAGNTFTISANTTLYAKWELIPTYTVTYNKNGDGAGGAGSVTGSVPTDATAYNSGERPVVKGPGDMALSGKTFIGWNDAANGSGTYYSEKSNFAITANKTLYAQWRTASSCPGVEGGTVFSLSMNDKTTDTESFSFGDCKNLSSYATITNGGASFTDIRTSDSPSGTKAQIKKANPGQIFVNGGDAMITLYLDCALQQGDVLAFTSSENRQLSITTTSTRSTTISTTSKSYTIPAESGLIGTKTIYLWRADNNSNGVTAITITRPSTCVAPSLAASSTTAKGTTFTVTDANDLNDYEFYVSTSSTAPVSGTTATYTSTSKTKVINNLYAGTTFYTWVRAVCGETKTAWTALSGNTFTTSTVTMTPTLTNVTHTSGATSGIGGSNYTAVFTASTGYSMPDPTVTIGGNAATSGTDYTWSVDGSVGTITIPANKINGNIAITLNSAKAAPSSVTVDGTWHRFPGETITLTTTVTGGNGPKTYQWYKGEDAIVGATSATYTKASCEYADAGDYWCTVTCGGTESTSSSVFQVKILRLYVKTGRYDGYEKADYGNVDFTKVDGSTATASISLGANWDYCFNIADGCGHAYGYAGEITVDNCTDWTINVNNQDCGLRSTNGAYYLFTIDYSAFPDMVLTVTYPTGDQEAYKIIYFDNQTVNWSTLHYRVGKTNHTQATAMTKVPGTNNLWKVTTTEYLGFAGWHIANNAGWTGDNNSIYRTYTNGDQYSITYATAHEGGAVTQAAVTVTPTTWKDKGGDAGINDNCDFYNYSITSGMKTQNVAISPYSNGTITVNYVNTSNVASTLTSGNADLAHTVILTSITAVPNTGYDASAITINGGAYSANYVVTGATTIAASFTPHTYSITYKDQGDVAFSGTHVDSPNAHPTSHTYATATTLNSATKTGYTFGGWFTNSACTGEAVASLGATAFSADITLYAKWTVNNYNLTWNLGGGTTTSAGTGIASGVSVNTTSSVAYGTSLTAPTVTKTGYNFSAWSPAVASTMPAEATTYTATWTLKTTTITINANTANHGSTTPGTVTATWGSALPSFTAATGASGWSLTGYWTAATGGNKIINADGTLVASTTYADGSGHWNSEVASLTLYAQYEEVCTPQILSKVVLTANNAGTVSGYNEGEYAGTAYVSASTETQTAEVDGSHGGNETGYKLGSSGQYVFTTISKGNFQAGDIVKITITKANDAYTFPDPINAKTAMDIYYGDNSSRTLLTTLTGVSAAGTYSYTLTASDATTINSAGKKGLGIYRDGTRKQNQYVYSVEIWGCRDWVIEEVGLVNWTMNLNTNTWGTSATSTTDETNISSIATSANTTDGTRAGTTKKINLASAADNVDNAASFTFSLNSAKKIEPEKVKCQVFNVSDDEGLNYKAQLSDNNGHVYYSTNTVIPNTEATLTDAVFNFASDLILTGNITIKVYCWKSSGSGTAFRMGPKIRFFGEVAAAADYTVTHTMSNVTKSAGATSVKEGNNYTATYAGAGGYALPSTITVTIGGSPATAGTDYTWTQGTGVVTIPGNKVTGNIVITVTGVAVVNYSITYHCNGAESGCPSNVAATTNLPSPLPTGLTKDGYDFGGWFTDSECTVAAVAGAALTGNTDLYAKWTERGSECEDTPHAWDVIATSAKSYKVRISKVTEEVAIPVADATASNLTAYAGSVSTNDNVTVQIADGGSSKYGYKFDGSNTYLKLVFSTPLVLNDTLVVGMTNASHNISFTTTAVRSTTLSTSGGKLIIPAALAGQSTIYLWRGSGSTMYLRSFAVKHECEAIPSCTTPTLPTATLSNQTVCEGSDIAAWDATPTNASTISGKSESISYSWKKKGNDTELATTATFDLGASAAESQAGTYVVTVTVSKAGYASSTANKEVDLNVTEGEEVTGIAADKATVYPGNSVTLTATANTSATWQWYTCTNAEGDGDSSIGGETSASYTIASAGAAGTYYYKAKATGTCGTASAVYTLVVSPAAGGDCETEIWVVKAADLPEGVTAATHITTPFTGGSNETASITIDGNTYTITQRTSNATGPATIVVPEGNTATLYILVKGNSGRSVILEKGGVQQWTETPEDGWQALSVDNLAAGTYSLRSSDNLGWGLLALKLCSASACSDPEVTASADNTTACVGTSVTFTAANAHAEATYQWQKLDGTWTNISGATASTYNIASVVAGDAGKYRVIASHACNRTSNEVTLSVPSAPDFGSTVPASVSVMQTIALSINTVEATDAVKYRWYKSADPTWDAGDVEIGTNKELIKAYDGEAIGSPSYYIFCRAQNACGITTSSAIAVNVTTYVEEDCATRGNEGDAAFSFENSGAGQGSYESTACWTMNSNSKILVYYPPTGKYFKTAKVTIASSSENKASYNWSTNGGTTYTAVSLTVNSTLTERTIDLSAHGNVNAFQIGRNFDSKGSSGGTLYVSKICFEYTDACTATTVTPSTASTSYEMGGAWSNPTFTLGPAAVSGETLTYSSSNEDIASVDDDGTVTFNGDAGTVTITASYAGGAIALTEYCASSGSYTITVSCTGGAPKVVASGTTVGCSSSITLLAKKQDGTAFADGTYQWFRNGTEIDGATSSSYTATQAGTYTVERTNTSDCTTPSTNSAIVTSETTEPEVERLVPFQYYHVDKTYSDQMKMRHLFAVKNSGTLDGKHFKMYVSRSGGAATDVTSSDALVVVPSDNGPVDTVKVDLNKLSGKYSENDELVFTCKAVDCNGNVSEVYKNTITMNVIGATPTLALICSGSSKAGGTRKTGELTVGGDFLTGYNVADLCQQTGNTSFDANTEWGLYTDLKTQYIVTPVNGYAVFNKLNYEPFDILLLTDYPKASKSDAAKDVLDDMAALCDYRPMLSFKTHMVAKSPSKWAAKGFTTSPVVTKEDGRLNLNIVCYAHPMFESLKTGEDVYTDVGNTSAPLVYTMLSGTGYESGKGMQGFELAAAENFVTIGLTHYNGTIAKDGSTATWTPGSEDRMLVTVAERQANPEARFILFSLNCGAQSKLTDKGEQVVLACLNYLLGTAEGTIEPADCSFTFDNGEGNKRTPEEQAINCPTCPAAGDHKWNNPANWGPDYRLLPGEFTSVRIKKPVEVNDEHAHVMEVRIIDEGSIDIPAGKALDVKSTIRRMDGSEIYPTEISDLTLEASTTSNGTLIFNNNAGDTKATVWAYSKGFIEDGVKNYQYIGTPFKYLNAVYNYYGSWIYRWDIKKNGNWGWVAVKNGGPMSAWTGYCITQESPAYYETSGTMTETGTVDIAVPAGNNMVVGNSWTAPIDINALTTDDLEGLVANIYFFNTGVDKKGTGGAAGSRYAGGTYVTVPVEAARYTGDDDHINSMQGFFVKNTSGSEGTLHLDYDRHVRGTTRGSIIGDALHAPKRAKAASDEPAVLKITVSGENYDDKLLLLAREDFTTGFDNGWDGDKWDGNESALYIYTKDEEGTENSVSALPEMEGSVIGFRAGEDDAYTLHFEYLNSAEELYLFDTETNAYTKIMTGATYRFFTEDKEKHERFIITRKSPQIATDVDEVDSGKRREVRKLLIEDKMYILVNGMLYDATGKVVK